MAHCGGQAIVIGASMGGLLAARAVAEHYDRVTVIERDSCPKHPSRARAFHRGGTSMRCSPGGARARTAVSWPDGTRRGRGCPRR